jgi:thiol-disulfide isomerase/thioredoxin
MLGGVLLASVYTRTDVESTVHQQIEQMMEAKDGDVIFSDLHGSTELSPAEREYLARLYEIFFAIPAYLQLEYQSTKQVATMDDIANNFGITRGAVELLLRVMVSDSRMPPLVARDQTSGEIESLDLEEIAKFVDQRGSQVKVSGWIGKSIPSFEATTFGGKAIGSRDLLGSNALIFFWLTHCPVCQRMAPNVVEIHERYGSAGLKILGFNVDEALKLDVPHQEQLEFVAERGIEYPNATLDQGTRAAFGNMNIFPVIFLVKPDGTISHLIINYRELDELDRLVREQIGSSDQ